jgi:hypothetical protein
MTFSSFLIDICKTPYLAGNSWRRTDSSSLKLREEGGEKEMDIPLHKFKK